MHTFLNFLLRARPPLELFRTGRRAFNFASEGRDGPNGAAAEVAVREVNLNFPSLAVSECVSQLLLQEEERKGQQSVQTNSSKGKSVHNKQGMRVLEFT